MLAAFVAPGLPTAWAAVGVALLFATVWAVSLRLRDVSIVDAFWGPAFVLVAAVVAVTGSDDADLRWVLLAMTALWGLRLGGFLLARFLRHDAEDPRYAAIRERHEGHFGRFSLVAIFGTQAVAVLVVSLPIQVAGRVDGGIGWAAAPGVALWAIGLTIEAIADEQQRRFSASDAAGVLDTGLWRLSRHPNKFGDLCAWWGIWLVALTAGGTWWTVVGPLLMSAVLLRGTGRGDPDEQDPDEAAYERRTSGFVPLPPRATSG